MKKGKVWYVESGYYYEGKNIDGIFATYEEAKKCYDRIVNRGCIDKVELWWCDLDGQKYDVAEDWGRDDEA